MLELRAKMVRTGSFETGAAPGRARLVDSDTEQRLLQIVRESPDATLNVLRDVLADETGAAVALSETTMWRQLETCSVSAGFAVPASLRP